MSMSVDRYNELMEICRSRPLTPEENIELKECFDKDTKEIELKDYKGRDRVISSYEKSDMIKTMPIINRYMSKINGLDALTHGFEEGELVVVSGWTKNGKTEFCKTLTLKFAEQKISCLWFTFEVGYRNFLERFPKLEADIPLFYLPNENIDGSLAWVENRIIESNSKGYSPKIIFIDHLHYLIKLGQTVNASLLIGGIMRELKKLAIRYSVVIMLIAHTQKLRNEQSQAPELADLRDSSFIAQESDMVIFISRNNKTNRATKQIIQWYNDATLYLQANRRSGDLGKVKLELIENKFIETEQFWWEEAKEL